MSAHCRFTLCINIILQTVAAFVSKKYSKLCRQPWNNLAIVPHSSSSTFSLLSVSKSEERLTYLHDNQLYTAPRDTKSSPQVAKGVAGTTISQGRFPGERYGIIPRLTAILQFLAYDAVVQTHVVWHGRLRRNLSCHERYREQDGQEFHVDRRVGVSGRPRSCCHTGLTPKLDVAHVLGINV